MKKILLVIGSAILIAGCHTDKNSGGTGSQSDTNFSTFINSSGGIGSGETGKSSGRGDSDANGVNQDKDNSGSNPDTSGGTPK